MPFCQARRAWRDRAREWRESTANTYVKDPRSQVFLISYEKIFSHRGSAVQILMIAHAKHVWSHPAACISTVSM